MTLPNETIDTGASARCDDCGQVAELGVHKSAAGYYIGTYCGCGPYSRESGYYSTRKKAEVDFEKGVWKSR